MFTRRRRGRWFVAPDAPAADLGGALPTIGPRVGPTQLAALGTQLIEEGAEEFGVAEQRLKLRVYADGGYWRWQVIERPSARIVARGSAADHAGALANGLRIWEALGKEGAWAPAES